MSRRIRAAGFTLVELLVVIAIIGMLVSLLLPAVQSAREAGRRSTCLNNIRQIGVASLTYENAQGEFPRASYKKPDHNWAPFLFPYLEEQSIRDAYNFDVGWKHRKNRDIIQTSIGVFSCPSSPNGSDRYDTVAKGVNAAVVDYGPITSYSKGLVKHGYVKHKAFDRTGVISREGTVVAHIKDGLSNTLMYAEDGGRPYFFTRNGVGPDNNKPGGGNLPVKNGRVQGGAWADQKNSIPLHGFSPDGLKAPGPCPINCTNNNEAFSFHPGGVNVVFADGHTDFLNEDMDIETYAALISRAGKEVIPSYQ